MLGDVFAQNLMFFPSAILPARRGAVLEAWLAHGEHAFGGRRCSCSARQRQAELGLNSRRRARSPAPRLALRGTPAAGELGAPGMHAYAGWKALC